LVLIKDMKLQNIFFLTFFFICQISLAQEKLSNFNLSVEEQEILNKDGNVFRESREYLDWNNLLCKGALQLFKINGKIEFNHIETWKHYYVDKTLKETYVFDKKGNLLKYDFYEEDGFNSYSCSYSLKNIEGTNYRIEHIKVVYPTGILKEDGYRFNTFYFINGAIQVNSPRKVGQWIYFNEKGEFVKKKVRRRDLARRLGINN
jgi:hypothetical protein